MFVWFRFRLLEQGQHSDIKFLVHGQTFPAHRCILSTRSEYFTEMFESKWKWKNLITLKHPLVDKLPLCIVCCDTVMSIVKYSTLIMYITLPFDFRSTLQHLEPSCNISIQVGVCVCVLLRFCRKNTFALFLNVSIIKKLPYSEHAYVCILNYK